MSPPPTSIDGTDITGATIDGQDVQEITVDGQTVFIAGPDIPDSTDLQARYDFSKEDGTLPITDRTGNGFDINSGGYSGVGVTINGVQAGEFDGGGDLVQTSFPTISQPISIFIAYEFDSVTADLGKTPRLLDGGTSAEFVYQVDGDSRLMFAGNNLIASTGDTNPHIFGGIYDGGSSEMRIDGSQLTTGNVGTNSMSGITIGASSGGGSNADVNVGEVLVYNGDKTAIAPDIESYLNDTWAVF